MVNPFLYSLLSKRFRRGFQDLVRNTKIWFRNLPIVVRLTVPASATKESERIVPDLPSNHTSSQQGRECLINNMCCTGTVIKKTVYRWKTNSKMIHDPRASIYISPNSNIGDNRNKDIMEMVEIPESAPFIRHSSKNSSDLEQSNNTSTAKKKNLTLRFDSDIINEQTRKSEGDATKSTNSCSIWYQSRNHKGKRIVSEGSNQPAEIESRFTIGRYSARSDLSSDIRPTSTKTVSTAFKCNTDEQCFT